MKILVTGANGFIGSHLVPRLARRHDVFAMARELPPDRGSSGAQWIDHDLTTPIGEAKLPPAIDAVIHLAQSRRYREFPDGAADIYAVNIGSTFGLLEYARAAGARSFVFASTGGVYGYSYEKLVETDPVTPIDFYLTSKYAAELLIANYERFFRTVVFRFFFVYGPAQKGMLLPTLLDRVRRGETIAISGAKGLRINPIFVDDAVEVFEPAIELGQSELMNVAGDEIVELGELVELMGRVAGTEISIERVGDSHDGDLVGDNGRMKEVLGVRPRTTLEQGIAAMLEGGR